MYFLHYFNCFLLCILFLSYLRVATCTRWVELVTTIKFIALLSMKMQIPSEFRLLNGADPVMIGLHHEDDVDGYAFLEEVLGEDPAGSTPLCQQINAVVAAIQSMERELREYGQKATVVIATDGEATDGDVAEAMRPLQNVSLLNIYSQYFVILFLIFCLFSH